MEWEGIFEGGIVSTLKHHTVKCRRVYSSFLTPLLLRLPVRSMLCVSVLGGLLTTSSPISPETRGGWVVPSPWAALVTNQIEHSDVQQRTCKVYCIPEAFLGGDLFWVCNTSVVEVMDSLGISRSFQRWSWQAGDERSGQSLHLQDIFIFLHLSPLCRENWGFLTVLSDWIHVKLISAR